MVKKHPDLFVDAVDLSKVKARRVRWQSTFRLIPSRYPSINLFERISRPEDWDALIELESLTNPRLREGVGVISLVPKTRRVSGPGASIVMAPFTHASPHRKTRFSDGTYGVYYAARLFQTALREVAFHMGRFYAATNASALQASFRTYKGKIDKVMHDITGPRWTHLLRPEPDEYAKPQAFARALRLANSNGIVYPSVRHAGGECIAAFWPDVVSIPIQTKHIELKWDGSRVTDWFDFETEQWSKL
jgi:hypothetical protein